MLRLSLYALLPLLLLALIFGCDENPSSPDQVLFNVTMSDLPDSLSSPQGATRTIPFTVTVINVTESIAVANEDITISIAGRGGVNPVQASTDSDGIIEGTYTVTMPLGESSATIKAQYGEFSDEATVKLYGTVRPVNVSLTADPPTVVVQQGGSATISLSAYISDANGVGVSNQPINFTMHPPEGDSSFGSLSPSYVTDNGGNAEATFRSQAGFGRMIVRCSAQNQYLIPPVFGEIMIEVIQQATGTGTVILSSNTDHIFADDGVTTARVSALLQNQRSEGISNEQIIFTANNNGIIPSPAITNNQGVAQVELRDFGLPSTNALGEREPCMVIAQNRRFSTADTIYIDIRPPENVQQILLSTERDQLGINGSIWVRAICFTDMDMTQRAAAGKAVRFVHDGELGRIAPAVVYTDDEGISTTQFIADAQVGATTIQAEVRNQDDILNPIYSNTRQINVLPGPPSRLSIEADPYQLTIDEVGAQSVITSTVMDSMGNPVRDGSVLVRFDATLGSVTPSSVQTVSGIAVGQLRPGDEAGVSTVTATVQTDDGELSEQTFVQFIAGSANSIELSADPLDLHVGGHNLSQSTLSAIVRDRSGNPMAIPTNVVFELITNDRPPQACTINDNIPFNMDTTTTAEGIATALLNAGTRIGPQLIRAYTLDDNFQPTGVETTLNSIRVVAGVPTSMSIAFNNDGLDAGGGAWQIEVSARVMDIYRNPVADDIPVVFSIVEEDIASIERGYTGNAGIISDPIPGVAFTRLTYSGRNTFQPITVEAYIITEDTTIVEAEARTVLPLQQGSLSLNVDPSNWIFDENDEDSCEILIWAICQDGHNRLVEDAPILFNTSRGRLFPTEDESGSAAVMLRGPQGAFFLNDESVEEIIEINATIEGYNIEADSVNVTMTRRRE